MARLTKHEKAQIVETFYGINPKTFEVESVSLTRGNELSKMARDGTLIKELVLHGRNPRIEVAIIWNFTDIISYRTGIFTSEQIKEGVAKLKEIAAQKKAAFEKDSEQ